MESTTLFLLENEAAVRFGAFLTLLMVLGGIETALPRRPKKNTAVRWTSNLGLALFNALLLRLVFPILALGMAELARHNGWGLFNWVEVPYPVAFLMSVVALDFAIYLQHAMFHHVPLLWRFHRVHHSDVVLDVSTAVRIHFVESILSMGIKLAAVLILGPPVLAVLAFEIWLNASSMFHHSNLRIPPQIDHWLRWLVVTPDMHRVHHSVIEEETNSNFAFNLPWWDRLLGTYQAQPREGHDRMTLGLVSFRAAREQHLDRLLIQPLVAQQPPSE